MRGTDYIELEPPSAFNGYNTHCVAPASINRPPPVRPHLIVLRCRTHLVNVRTRTQFISDHEATHIEYMRDRAADLFVFYTTSVV